MASDFADALASVVAIAQSARSATSGWRAICVRERRRLGGPLIDSIAELDLDDDAAKITNSVRALTRRSAFDIDTLAFGLFGMIDDGTGAHTGYHVSGIASRGRSAAEFMLDPWTPEPRHLRSDVLDAVLRATPRARHLRPVVEYLLLFGAALLTSRFAVGKLPYRIVVGFDEDHPIALPADAPRFVELVELVEPQSRRSPAPPLIELL